MSTTATYPARKTFSSFGRTPEEKMSIARQAVIKTVFENLTLQEKVELGKSVNPNATSNLDALVSLTNHLVSLVQ